MLVVYMGVCDSRQLVTGTTCREDRLAEIEAAKKFAVIDTYVMYVQKDHVTLDTVPQKEVVPRSWPCPGSSSYNRIIARRSKLA